MDASTKERNDSNNTENESRTTFPSVESVSPNDRQRARDVNGTDKLFLLLVVASRDRVGSRSFRVTEASSRLAVSRPRCYKMRLSATRHDTPAALSKVSRGHSYSMSERQSVPRGWPHRRRDRFRVERCACISTHVHGRGCTSVCG